MLHLYINSIISTLESHVQSRLGLKTKVIELCNFSQINSEPNLKNKILASLVNISREKDIPSNYDYVAQGNSFIGKRGPLLFNIEILFAANFESKNSIEGLRQLSAIIGFFQANSSMSMPLEFNIGDSISSTVSYLESESLDRLWGRLSVPYMPSFISRFSTLSIRDEIDKGLLVPRVDTIDIQPIER